MDPVSTGMGPVTFSQQQIDHLVTLLKKLLSGLSAPQAPGKGAAQRGLPHGIGQALQSALLSPLSLDGDTLSLGGGSDEV